MRHIGHPLVSPSQSTPRTVSSPKWDSLKISCPNESAASTVEITTIEVRSSLSTRKLEYRLLN
jgi:hypothetical protein